MSKEELHEIAVASTPESVNIPATWGGLFVWAVGKWGVGVVFAGMLVPVYTDLKASNQQVAEISKANIIILTQLSAQIEDASSRTTRVEEAIRELNRHADRP
jgi:hypothetical protein